MKLTYDIQLRAAIQLLRRMEKHLEMDELAAAMCFTLRLELSLNLSEYGAIQ
jgi:hypothetical protein